jgi:hypothetical protein
MGLPLQISKTLAAASANNIATSQSPGAGAIVLNGSATAGGGGILTIGGLGAITAGSGYVPGAYRNVPATGGSGSGAVFGSVLVGSTGTVIAVSMIGGSPGSAYAAADSLSATAANLGGTGSGFAVAVATGGVTTAVATLDTQRRVIVTSGSNDTGINFTVNGTNDAGVAITDTFAGASGGAAQSNLDFKTVTSVTHTGSVAGTVTVGTNGVGSTPWLGMNWHAQPSNISADGVVVSGTVNWSFQYTYDDMNNLPSGVSLPTVFTHSVLNGVTGTQDGVITAGPVSAVRFLINSGTGAFRGTVMQAGISGQ